jgi:FKBP-type peptidyl-prolyl cis-trans isomerase 2
MIKKNDFIELDYTGAFKDGTVFDTTREDVATKNNIHGKNVIYKPAIVCVGAEHLLKGLENFLIGKELGTYHVELTPEQAFGKKNAKLIQLIPTSQFRKQKINPVPGLQLNMDGMLGTIKIVTGGRTTVDFNHPFSGKDVSYDIDVKRVVTDPKEKLLALLKISFSLEQADIAVVDNKATIKIKQQLPENIVKAFVAHAQELTKLDSITIAQ